MARTNCSVAVLLFLISGMVIVGEMVSPVEAKLCPRICYDVKYITCASTGKQMLPPVCNCCLASPGCTLHLADGSAVTCA